MQPTDAVSLRQVRQIDQLCSRFESEWHAGARPRVEDYLATAPAQLREPLLRALLPVELELQERQGKPASEAECRSRFPDLARVVADVFAMRKAVRTRAEETSVSRESAVASTLAKPAAVQPVPTTIGRFEVIRVLGEGAFGTVYLGLDPRLDRQVAIKVPKVDALGAGFDTERFLSEARTAASLHHPNLCPVYEADVHDGRPYIVMAHVAGQSLDKLLKSNKGPLPAKQAALVTRRLALALQAAHDKGIVHRDLKPANVMIDRERKDVVVMDFGLARDPRLKDARATQSGVIMGTPAYMSPEQARGEAKTLGPAADIYSLGVMLYEMLAGSKPFNGTVTEVLGKILHVQPEPPSKVRPGVDAKLEAICMKAMAKDPKARFASMKEFAAALDAWLRTPGKSTAETARAADTKGDASASVGASTRQVAEVFAAMLEQQKEETAAAVGEAVRKARTPRWVFVMLALLFVGSMTTLAGLILFARTPTAKVTIELTDIDLADKTLSFFLDGAPIGAEKLAGEVELKVGEHVLLVKKGEKVVKQLLLTVTGGREPGIKTKDITPPGDDDLARWQGRWRSVAENTQGRTLSEEEVKERKHIMVIDGNRRKVERTLADKDTAYEGTIRLNPAASPKEFDFEGPPEVRASARQSGLYEFVGPRLRVIYRSGTRELPVARASWADKGQQDVVWFEFERDEERDYVSLFNGKDLDGWEAPTRPGAFAVDPNGFLTAKGDTPSGRMHWLTTRKEYTDYILRLDFQFALPPPAGTNSGIAIRSATDGDAVRPHRLYVELRNLDREPKPGALVYTTNDAVEPKTPIGPLSTGEWHSLEIEVRGPSVKVTIDGKLVNDVDMTKIDRTLLGKAEKWAEAELDRKKGHIGIESWKNPTKFRNIRVKELPK